MTGKCLIAEFRTLAEAKLALEALQNADFTLDDVSVVSTPSDPTSDELDHIVDADSESVEKHRSVNLGMLIGGTIAAPIAAGTLVGPLIVAGPLIGMAIGASVGGLISSVSSWGVSHEVAEDYERRVESGSVLVLVHHDDSERIDEADRALQQVGPLTLERHQTA